MTPGAAPGIWLLEVDAGGEVLRVASRACVVPSRRAGGAQVRYTSGLDPVTSSGDVDDISLDLRAPGYALDRLRIGSVGRAATLRWWRGEPHEEDARTVCDGIVVASEYGRPDRPDGVTVTISRASDVLSSDVCPPLAIVDPVTWPTADPAIDGAVYPRIIGAPGAPANDSATGSPLPATPALQVEPGGGVGTLLVAGHHVPAAQVEVYDLTEGTGAHDTYAVLNTTDGRGQPVATVDLLGGALAPVQGARLGVGWSDRIGWGRGTTHRGREVRGLGDVLIWGADLYGRVRWDQGEAEARRAALNRYQIDACINVAGLPWDEWAEANLADLFQLELVQGRRGVYWREIAWTADPSAVRATLVADRSRGGVRVVRESGVAHELETDGGCNQLTVLYGQNWQGTLTRRVVFGAVGRASAAGDPDARVAGHPLCARARERAGGVEIARSVSAWCVWGQASAVLVGQLHVARLAMPHGYVTVSGGAELQDIAPYTTVRLVDGSAGLDVLAVTLPGATLGQADRVRLQLRIPPG